MAKQADVSVTTYCNHFGDIDELFRGMYSYVIDRPTVALKQAAEDNPCHNVTIPMGVVYAEFFAKYSHYFSSLFDIEYLGTQIKETEITRNSSFTPFEIFVNGVKRGTRESNIDEKELRDDPLVMWVVVHGLAVMANMKGVQYGNGDWGVLIERILLNRVTL